MDMPDTLVDETTPNNPRFLAGVAWELYAGVFDAKELSGEIISSPADFYSVETLRDKHALRIGERLPCDIFIQCKGSAPSIESTKVGGTPYWPDGVNWPLKPNGSPMLFLTQINFMDSVDIVPELPGDILVLLIDELQEDFFDFEDISPFWFRSGQKQSEVLPADISALPGTEFFGAIHRSADYPDAEDKACDLDISQSYNLALLSGTKIGGEPAFIQYGYYGESRFIAQLGSIQASSDTPFPWGNVSTSLEVSSEDPDIYSEGNSVLYADMGSIYLFLDDNGDLEFHMESY